VVYSASRRTDIPAFYGDWMIRRLREGRVASRNPRNPRQVSVYHLDPAVDALVFWTKDPGPFLPRLPEIDALGYPYYFQFTLTGYGPDIEPALGGAPRQRIIDTFIELSRRIGPDRVVWRYDPILLTPAHTPAWHLDAFERIADRLAGRAASCVISFADRYAHLASVWAALGVQDAFADEGADEGACAGAGAKNLAEALARAARARAICLTACAEDIHGVAPSRCVDPEIIARVSGRPPASRKDPGQRAACHCAVSRDIGAYRTCRHGCVYCYAAAGPAPGPYDPDSPLLCGGV